MKAELLVAIYGAVLSTTLGALSVLRFLKERPRISVEAVSVSTPSAEGERTHGVLVRVKHGGDILWEEADVEIRVRNAGTQACQITDVFIETATAIQQVRPAGLPVILDPNTSSSVRVQPEYFAPKGLTSEGRLKDLPVEAVGVFDGLGKKHRISAANLVTITAGCRGLPLRTGVYKHREKGHLVVAFQVRDVATIVSKTGGSA
jgi:hypothetical protein